MVAVQRVEKVEEEDGGGGVDGGLPNVVLYMCFRLYTHVSRYGGERRWRRCIRWIRWRRKTAAAVQTVEDDDDDDGGTDNGGGRRRQRCRRWR